MKRLTLDNFVEEVLESEKPYMVLFKNSSCHLCRGFTTRALPKLYRRYNKKIGFGIVDTNLEEDLMDIFEVEGVPTIFIFEQGEGRELEFPDNPNPFSGYHEKDVSAVLAEVLGE